MTGERVDALLAEADAMIEKTASSLPDLARERFLAGQTDDPRMSLVLRLAAELREGRSETEVEFSPDVEGPMGIRYVTKNVMLAETMALTKGGKVLTRRAPEWREVES